MKGGEGMGFGVSRLGGIDTLVVDQAQKTLGLGTGDRLFVDGGMVVLEHLGRIVFLDIPEPCGSERADAEHADSGDHIDAQGSALGKLLRDDSQRGWPEESLAESVECGDGKDQHEAADRTEQEQSDGGQSGRDGQQVQRQQSMDDRAGKEPEDHHDHRGVDQHPSGVDPTGCHFGFHQWSDPAVGAQFGGGQRDPEQHHQEKDRSALDPDICRNRECQRRQSRETVWLG